MYTKLLLLAATSIIISSSIVIDSRNMKITVQPERSVEEKSILPTSQKTRNTLPFGIDLSDIPHQENSDHAHSHSSDDDGKTHHFHFDHYTSRRKERILSLMGKLVVIATFISTLISGFYVWN